MVLLNTLPLTFAVCLGFACSIYLTRATQWLGCFMSTSGKQRNEPNNNTSPPKPGIRHLWQGAMSYAAWAHRHQVRKDHTTPYCAHVARVAMTVSNVFEYKDEITLAIALLHDTIEDTTTDYEDLRSRFGTVIADGVSRLTKNMALPKELREPAYDLQIADAPWNVKLVKLADVYDNFCDVDTSSPEKVQDRKLDAIEKCGRAIAIARNDASKNPVLLRAAELVEALVAEG